MRTRTGGARPQPVILLRADALGRRLDEHHAHSYQAKGDFLGLSKSTVIRTMNGDVNAGETFIASVLFALGAAEGREPGAQRFGELFDELFEVTTLSAEQAA